MRDHEENDRSGDRTTLAARLHRVVELPLPPEHEDERGGDRFGAARRGALAAAFHGRRLRESGLVWGWLRPARSGPVELLTTEPRLAPPGSLLVPASESVVALESLRSWVDVALRPVGPDGSGDADVERDGRSNRRPASGRGGVSSLESVLLPVWDGPFAVVVQAFPASFKDATDAVERVGEGVRYTKGRAEKIPELAFEADRLTWWHRELLDGASGGLWWTRLRLGGQTETDALELAGLACSSFPARGLGYELTPLEPGGDGEGLRFYSLEHAGGDKADNRGEKGFLTGSGLLSALCRPPSVEVPGVRQVLPQGFDTTSEHVVAAGRGVKLGSILDAQRNPAGSMVLPYRSLNRHALIPGATGSGKSVTGRTIAQELVEHGVPVTVIEPAKAEWARALASRLPEHQVVRIAPGEAGQVACCLDPMRPIRGFPLQTHIDLVRSLFLAAFDADEPFPQVLSAALQRAYERQGWNTLLSAPTGGHARYPTLADLQASAAEVVDEIGYGPEVHQNIQGFVKVRLSALRLGTSGRFLEGGHPLDMDRLLSSNVVFEIQDVGDDAEKSFTIGAFLLKLIEYYRVAEREGRIEPDRLRHVTFIEEAHRLLRNPEGHAGAANQAVEMFASLLAEVRAYGEGVIVAEQIPSKLIPDAIKNSSIKICHRLPAKDDRDTVGATMNLTDQQSEYLVTVKPGEAAVFADGMDRPVLVRVPDAGATEQAAVAPAGPKELCEPLFGRCAAGYGLTGITLGTIAQARELLNRTPMLIWWVELAVLAHLTGRVTPHPPLAIARTLEESVWKTAVVLAVDEAVATRSAVIRSRVPPAELAVHVTTVLIGMLGGKAGCRTREDAWVAAPYVWDRVAYLLEQHRTEHPDTECGQPHPHTDAWKIRYGDLPGRTCKEQLAAVEAWRRLVQSNPVIEDLAFGTRRPSALEEATGLVENDPRWLPKVRDLTEGLGAPWAASMFDPATR